MKTIKTISLVIAGLIILGLIVAAIIPDTMVIERKITIDRPVTQVFTKVADLASWQKWNPWTKIDPEAELSFSTPSRGVGANWSWQGDKIGKGKLTTEEIDELRSIRFKLEFEEPISSQATDLWQFNGKDNGTTAVTWRNSTYLDYPLGRLSSLYLKPLLEEQFEQGLQDLKQLVELEAAQQK